MNVSTHNRVTSLAFALTIFVSATLLFVVQPMVGKMLLPHMGGSSSVWTTCMLFFQAMLVLGYGYAHVLAQKLAPKRQVWLHLVLLVLALAVSLPFTLDAQLLESSFGPLATLLGALFVAIGLPLFVVSSSAPLFQHWFGFTGHPDADDPYYLYAASNAGSMLALFAYPFVVERLMTVETQAESWAWGFGGLTLLAATCGMLVLGSRGAVAKEDDAVATRTADPLTWKRRGWWLLITFIPSSLMLGVTHYLTTDLASVPLFWVLPLGLYLLSFILVFGRMPFFDRTLRFVLPPATLLLMGATVTKALPMSALVVCHLLLFFGFAMYFHGKLAQDRPHTEHLTEFYMWMSVGGALGGVFNALLAPVLFDWSVEFFLVLALAIALMRPFGVPVSEDEDQDEAGATTFVSHKERALRIGSAVLLVVAVADWVLAVDMFFVDSFSTLFGFALVASVFVGFSVKFPMTRYIWVALVLLVGAAMDEDVESTVAIERSFYSDYRVYERNMNGHRIRVLSMGTTQHGLQDIDPGHEYRPVGYYHPAGPIGDIYGSVAHEEVAVAGLGAGALAPYTKLGTRFTFYEIDPVVEAVAREQFTYLDHCGDKCEVQIGDARKLLEEEPPGKFDLLFMDAYSSDSVPTHLLTREAVELYMSRVKEDGVVVCHVSNRYLDVESVVGAIAEDLGLATRTQAYRPQGVEEEALAYTAVYTVLARDEEDLGAIADDEYWRETDRADVVWTDDFTNIVSVMYWD
ncbi:MAG: spermidine synthase [Myxococcota bacterium]